MEDLSHYFNDAMAQIGHESDNIPNGAAAQNAATSATKEDIAQIFGGDKSLTEEFTDRATTAFNALVEARVIQARAELEEEYEKKLAEEAETVVADITEKLNSYLEYVASEWIKENKLAVEASVKTEIAESLMQGIYNLFVENNLSIPENKVDVVESLVAKVEQLEASLNEETSNNINLQRQIQEGLKKQIFADVTEGMITTSVEKLKVIAESLEFVSEEDFRKKLNVLKETNFDKSVSTKPQKLVEESLEEVEDEVVEPDNRMKAYVQAISNSLVKD
jgi:hypothetical protein